MCRATAAHLTLNNPARFSYTSRRNDLIAIFRSSVQNTTCLVPVMTVSGNERWFDRNDTPEQRSVVQVHPRGDHEN
jgi:hypothetical protein